MVIVSAAAQLDLCLGLVADGGSALYGCFQAAMHHGDVDLTDEVALELFVDGLQGLLAASDQADPAGLAVKAVD